MFQFAREASMFPVSTTTTEESQMSRLVLTALMVGLLLGAGAMSHGQDRVPVLKDDPTKGPEFRNKVNREKLLQALREHRDVHVHFIFPAGQWHALPVLKALRERKEGVHVTLGSGTTGMTVGHGEFKDELGIRGSGEGTGRLVYGFRYGQDAKKPFTITIDYTFTKRRAPDGRK
jgi:hypothetical protein